MIEAATSAAHLNWSAERSALVADVLRGNPCFERCLCLRVYGESMLPTLWPGDVVEVESCSLADVRPGEIALAYRDGRLFLHRFVGRRSLDTFVMRGDSMPDVDPPFPAEALIGRLVPRVSLPQSGRRQSSAAKIAEPTTDANQRTGLNSGPLGVAFLRAMGFVICHFGVARRLVLKLHRHRNSRASRLLKADSVADLESMG